jgi:hypothetical protein
MFGRQIGKDSSIIRGRSEQAGKDIGAGEQRALAKARLFHGGNIGRARGEELEIKAGATDARNRLSLDTGEAQEGYRDTNLRNYASMLGNLFNTGLGSINNKITAAQARFGGQREAAGVRAGASSQFASDVAGIGGDLWGQEQARDDRRWTEKMFKKYGLFK